VPAADPDPRPAEDSSMEASRAPFLEHLEELRWRLWRAVVGIFLCAIVCYLFHEEIFFFLTQPLYDVMAARQLGDRLVYRSIGGVFAFHMQVAGLGGLFFGMPILLWQLWAFIGPGLYKREKAIVLPFVLATTLCFVGGAAFGYFLVLPDAFDFLLGYSIQHGPQKLVPDINIEDYLDFVVKLLLGFGIAFELPTIAAALAFVGIITHRALIRVWRYAVVAIFVIAALLTPPDVMSQMLMAVPLLLLYALSIGICYWITRRREQRQAAQLGMDPP
jgi:sec-independent protein translocase protein TatC